MFSRFPLRAHCRSSINPLGSRPAIRCTSNHNSPQSDTPLAGNVGFLPRGPDVGPFSWCGVPNENGPRSEDGEPLIGCGSRNRTGDLRGMNPTRCLLRYPAIVRFFRAQCPDAIQALFFLSVKYLFRRFLDRLVQFRRGKYPPHLLQAILPLFLATRNASTNL